MQQGLSLVSFCSVLLILLPVQNEMIAIYVLFLKVLKTFFNGKQSGGYLKAKIT
jgi:hypothetical protein